MVDRTDPIAALVNPAEPPLPPDTDVNEPTDEQSGRTRLRVAFPLGVFKPGGGLPDVTRDGVELDADVAKQVLEIAARTPGVTLEKSRVK